GGGLRRTAKMMMLDLAAARARWIAEAATDQGRTEREASDFSTYQDADGLFADFHANRHTFVSNLERAGVSLTTAQKLARHSDPRLTANIYTHLGVSDRAAAIAALPAPPSTTPCAAEPGQQAVLGSDRDSARARWGQKWEQLNGEPEHTVASAGVAETGPADEPTRPNPLPLGTLGPCLPAVASAGASSGAGTRTPDTRIMIQTPAPVNPGRNGHFQKVGAVVGAVGPGIGAILAPDLQAVIAAWPALSDEARQRILEIIRRPRG
ncbi:MAG TPA: tyrosine-type recombinase/integrase, partial [Phycisphaerae bacterium]|nr:tyrosine-type recombinase/integrase [Phycisphaerae bacterium]